MDLEDGVNTRGVWRYQLACCTGQQAQQRGRAITHGFAPAQKNNGQQHRRWDTSLLCTCSHSQQAVKIHEMRHSLIIQQTSRWTRDTCSTGQRPPCNKPTTDKSKAAPQGTEVQGAASGSQRACIHKLGNVWIPHLKEGHNTLQGRTRTRVRPRSITFEMT
jgi:hypothetical protein